MSQPIAEEIYLTIAGEIDDQLVSRVFDQIPIAIKRGVKIINAIIQSNGGYVGSGVSLYNYFRGIPIVINTHNIGTVSSIAVIVFLAGQRRKAHKAASFMIHKTQAPSDARATASMLQAVANGNLIDDDRTEAILREHLTLPEDIWAKHASGPLTVSAQKSKVYGFIHEIEDFVLPPGAAIYNV